MSQKTWMEGYGSDPRDEPVPEEVRPQRGRKDTKHWCKGKVGREHTVETVWHHGRTDRMKCHESDWEWMKNRWVCHHAIRCTTCGKYVKTWLTREECPSWAEAQTGPR